MIKLKIDDFDFLTNRVRVGKTEKYLNREIRSALADYLPKRHAQNVTNIQALFISQIGTRLSSRSISNRVEYWLNRAGISSGVSAKNLRSTFAVRLYSVRPNLRLLQEALDYKNIETAVVYAVLMDGELESAMEEI